MDNSQPTPTSYEITCQQCGKKAIKRRKDARFCSDYCRGDANNIRVKEAKEGTIKRIIEEPTQIITPGLGSPPRNNIAPVVQPKYQQSGRGTAEDIRMINQEFMEEMKGVKLTRSQEEEICKRFDEMEKRWEEFTKQMKRARK